jgi:uncharacterized HAD superfamily protein
MVTNKGKKLVDYYYMMLKDPHLFEWNLLSANVHIDSVATDLDGVLCHDCPPEADDDGEKYANWIKNVLPYMIPNFTIETIITSRLEKYRTQTEEWLKSYKVKYKQLVMLNDQTRNSKKSVSHKVSVIKKTKPLWFFESDFSEAEEIQRKTKCKVVCVNDL